MPLNRGLTLIAVWPLLILLVAAVLHVYFFQRFPPPELALNDERVYATAATRYAEDIWSGHGSDILSDGFNNEHPVLGKLLYAGGILVDWVVSGHATLDASMPSDSDEVWSTDPYSRLLSDSRVVSAILGVLAVFTLARMNVIAGLFLAVSTPMLVYSSAAYLEASGVFFSILAMYCATKVSSMGRDGWHTLVIAAGVAAGMGIASKYYFVLVIPPILFYLTKLGSRRQVARSWLLFLGAATLAFGICDMPFLVSGFAKTSDLVAQNGLEYASEWSAKPAKLSTHWYTEFTLLSQGITWFAQPRPFALTIDPVISALGALGGLVLLRQGRVEGVWLAAVSLFLALYPVKFPQYTMLAVAPLCWCAGECVQLALARARASSLRFLRQRPMPS
jgi:hypothetical protein